MSKYKDFFSKVQYALTISWSASRKYFILYSLMTVIIAFLPYLSLLLWRGLINNLVAYIDGSRNDVLPILLFFAFNYCLILLLEKFIHHLSMIVLYKYNDAFDFYLDNMMVDKVSSIELAFFDSSNMSDKINYSWYILFSIKSVHRVTFDFINSLIKVIIALVLLCTLSVWILPFVIIVCIPYIFGNREAQKLDYDFEKKYTYNNRKMNYIKDIFFRNNLLEIKLYHLKSYFTSLYEKEWSKVYESKHKNEVKKCWISIGTFLLILTYEIYVYIISFLRLIARQIQVGDVIYYVSLLDRFRQDFTMMWYMVNDFYMFSKEFNDIIEFIDMEPLMEKGGRLIPTSKPKIEFTHVWFKYPNAQDYVLKDCSFVIHPGESIGLVGLNGSGKSTIVKLLLRFYDPSEGEIMIDGITNKEYDITALRSLFSVMFQDYIKYSFTAKENIMLSNLDKDSQEDLEKACKQSEIYEVIKGWDKGLDENLTRLFDQEGKELSGGQWQRFALARAFYRNTDNVILDEPSAALDPIAEHNIFEKFSLLSKEKSSVLISHRLSNITIIDTILYLEDGQIIEQGTHLELLKCNGRYAYLFNLQASKYVD